jgi:transposase-like protein
MAGPPDPIYAVVFFDTLRVKSRNDGLVKNKAGKIRRKIHVL